MMTPSPRFEERAPGRSSPIAILPLGAHEQHGPHLPFETDTLIAEGIAGRLKMALPADLPVTFLPAETVGYSVEHMDVEGTKTLTFDGAVNRWLGIAEGLAKKGIHKFVMLNAHGGNSPLMTIVATEARVRFAMLAVATSWTRFGLPDGVILPEEKAIGIHGGDIETSVMLALHPDKVDMAKAADFPSRQSEFAGRFKHLRAYGPHAFGWKMPDLNLQGAAGNAAAATAEKGEALLAHAVRGLVELLEDVDAFDVSEFR
ncbi:creatininase family protein [Rhizobium binae]|uniref:creatininase family protein n=1 Tax=Rhizobium binae TaxID=1138190 RepID=UPI0014416AA8|nr:creatininase family protein [Rhizobium binae]NKL50493.1 creatininase family protein [Rhizobium leguminosarum bv. viciae]MBX4928095.1 creatininase family protein [Rhizobium binae]MBX4938247.1 creatininase family protein [Rhizobium binae]MBX4944753.1 creatininase family protein [Rhizobium binae]MBX4962058.1 creatininase family protein [Rhizobium binae]